MTIVLYAL